MKKYITIIIPVFITVYLIAGCSGIKTMRITERPLEKGIPITGKKAGIGKEFNIKEPAGKLTLKKALSMALMKNPELLVFSLEIRAREAKTLQASLYPNPEVDIELDNVSSFGGNETSIWLGQLIETGGKIEKRTKVAALESDLAVWDYEAKRIKVFIETAKAFTSVISAQERVKLNNELASMSEELVKTIEKRVKAGKVSSAELSRAKVELFLMRIKLKKSFTELDSARVSLSRLWGSPDPGFEEAAGKLGILSSIPALAKLNPLVQQNPDLARWKKEMEHRKANLELQEAMRLPDPTLKGGYRRLNETKENAFQVGVTLPLIIFNRNQGAIKEARVLIEQAKKERLAIEVKMLSRLKKLYNSLLTSHHEVLTLKNKTMPEAEKAYKLINRFYIWGRYSFLDVLYARRTIFEVREQYLNALSEYNHYAAEIEGTIVRSLKSIK